MSWRLYRLPGSREWWLIDSGKKTPILKVLAIEVQCCRTITMNDPTNGQPIAWFEIEGELHLDEKQQKAIFT